MISIVIPAHNEAKVIGRYLKEVLKEIPNCELIVVCNGCKDGTEEVVNSINDKRIRCISIPQSAKGLAITLGFKLVSKNSKLIGFVDGDGAFSANTVKRMLEILNSKNVDMVIASKWKGIKQDFKESYLKKLLRKGWKLLVRLLFNMKFSDTQAGAKFMKRYVYEKIDKNFVCKGFTFDVELLYKASRAGFKILEVPTKVKYSRGSFGVRHTPFMLLELLKLKLLTLKTHEITL